KAIIDWRSGRELRLRPNLQNRRRQHMRRRMTQTFDLGHLRAHLRSFAFFFHLLGGEINHEGHEGHGEFRMVLCLAGRLRFGSAGSLPVIFDSLSKTNCPRQTSLQCSDSARVSHVGDDVSSACTFCGEIVWVRRRKSKPDWRLHARRARYPETEVNAACEA